MHPRCLPVVLMCLPATILAAADRTPNFNRDIRPLLSDNCFACHGPDANHRQADLRLDLEANAKEVAIVEGSPDVSELITRITSSDPQVQMPPPASGKSLKPEQIELLKRWIVSGAKYEAFWAYVPPKRHAHPDVDNSSWPRNWIDNFILNRLSAEGLSPSPAADRVTLLRRLSFDLTGLPPTLEETAAFLSDESEGAYEQAVDRLLASDRYGERMAIYWLDLVRYADTVGYHGDQEHHISPYRDYVIHAFNDNLAFDQFTREQLAGDLLPDPTTDQIIATGYNRLLQTSHEGGVQAREYLAIYSADHVRNLSAVWMGGTLGCAQCHDHKFDPYTTRDFYAMAAFFADIDEGQHLKKGSDSTPTVRAPELKLLTKRERLEIAALETELAKLETAADESRDASGIEELKNRIATLKDAARLTMVTQAIAPRDIRVLPRGNWLDDSGPLVQPAVPEFMGTLPSASDQRLNRLDLANWLVDAERGIGGLTARVFVNRLWYLLFGVGLSKSLEDFGGQGEPPIHPELLDNLAVEFVEGGWDVKRLVKTIVMSSAYRQSSIVPGALRERDPENRLYARQGKRRLAAEMIRDNALAISGLLVLEYGGPSARPYQPEGYYKHLNFPKREYESDAGPSQWRRGVYMHWQRQYLHPMLKAFDAPTREECTAARPRSNTPLAALVLLNDPTFVEAARAFAARVMHDGGLTDHDRLTFAFTLATSRSPDDHEKRQLMSLLSSSREDYADDPQAARKVIAIGYSPVEETLPLTELAAWTSVCRALLNLDEVITRN